MKIEHIQQWINALRSGKYNQCEGVLHHKDSEGRSSFCCLGVAIDVLIASSSEGCCGKWSKEKYDHPATLGPDPNGGDLWFDGEACLPSDSVLFNLELDEETCVELADKNDNGESFNEIADWIELRADRIAKETGRTLSQSALDKAISKESDD